VIINECVDRALPRHRLHQQRRRGADVVKLLFAKRFERGTCRAQIILG
jgi:hypothetical protein